jgi:lysozyme
MSFVLDTSRYQGATINFAAAKAAGCSGVYVKTTEGAGSVDPTWRTHHDAAMAVGLPVGAYHFADMGAVAAEAGNFSVQLRLAPWQLDPVLDIETANATASWLIGFRAQLRADIGDPWFRAYSSVSLLNGPLAARLWLDANSTQWAAEYGSALRLADMRQAVMWQNTSSASVPGIVGNVDEDQFLNGWTPAADSHGSSATTQGDDMPAYQLHVPNPTTDDHLEMAVKGCTELYFHTGYGVKLTCTAVMFFGRTATDWGGVQGVGGEKDNLVIGVNQPGPIAIPAGAVQVSVRYECDGPWTLSANS